MTFPMRPDTFSDEDGLYVKYRVFREPDYPEIPADAHPVEVVAYTPGDFEAFEAIDLVEVEAFTFVLKPDNDHHARVALAAYAASVRADKPALAHDLEEVLALLNEA